jgi:2,3-bisphosphoglycerate-dependent phosphoglycerate mutase
VSMAMEIVLIRHGQPEWVKDGRAVVNPPLTDLGHRQAEAVAQALRGEHFDEILVSPLIRARQTAAPLLAALGRAEVIAPWLEEMRDPDWHGEPSHIPDEAYTSGRARPAEHQWDGIPGGEPMRDFVRRVTDGTTTFLTERGGYRTDQSLPVFLLPHDSRRIALVAHAGTNSVAICHLLGIGHTPWDWDRFRLHHASITRLGTFQVGDGAVFGIRKLSDVEHLGVDERTH